MDTVTKTDNELIAEFMGLVQNPYRKGDYSKPEDYLETKAGKFGCWETPKYDTSWDWLMPVVEKITPMATHIGQQAWFDIGAHLVRADIKVVYKAVVEFIKWYNAQKS